jgi:hypothetical protein
LVSNLGYLLWMATAAICLFTSCSEVTRPRGRERELLLAGGLFSLLLCLELTPHGFVEKGMGRLGH